MQTASQGETTERAAPRVTIVLPVYNSEKELPGALAELDKQSFTDREIIIVDDGSSDQTWGVAEAASVGRRDITLERTDHRGPASARNAGLKLARGEIVFFSEADCVYDSTYLSKAVESMDTEKAAAVCLTGAPLVTRATMATNCIDIENKVQHRLLEQRKIDPFYAWVFRRDVLLTLGGFDERLFQGEDRDLFKRLKDAKYTVAWVPGVNWRHVRDQTTSELAAKWFQRGRTRLLYLIKHRRVAEMAKALAPLWVTVLGLILLFWIPLVGTAALLIVAVAFLARTFRVIQISWPVVSRKRSYLGYPFFILVRNFTTAMGYTVSLFVLPIRRLQGRRISWDTI